MPAKKNRGVTSHNFKKFINNIEVKPTKFVYHGGRNIMGGSVDGEMVVDEKGDVIPFHNIVADYR